MTCYRLLVVLYLFIILTSVYAAPLQLQLLPALQLRSLQIRQQPMMVPFQLQMPMIQYSGEQEPVIIVPAQQLMSEHDMIQELALMQMLQQPTEQQQKTLSQQHVMHQMPPSKQSSKQQPTLMQLLRQQQPMQQISLQQQMMELQQTQAAQNLNAVHSPLGMYPLQPFLILLPNSQTRNENEENGNYKNTNEKDSDVNDLKHEREEGFVNEDLESVIINAASEMENSPKRAILLIPNPNARFSIGGAISAIPWLPFEVNVPDTISWIYDGISGIISIIGQRLPFRPKPLMGASVATEEAGVKMFLKQMQNKQDLLPVYVLPMENIRLPIQV